MGRRATGFEVRPFAAALPLIMRSGLVQTAIEALRGGLFIFMNSFLSADISQFGNHLVSSCKHLGKIDGESLSKAAWLPG
ncbi:MAG: hypothetical protein AAGU11_23780 [Syntrophobacteraceae bacterium]